MKNITTTQKEIQGIIDQFNANRTVKLEFVRGEEKHKCGNLQYTVQYSYNGKPIHVLGYKNAPPLAYTSENSRS